MCRTLRLRPCGGAEAVDAHLGRGSNMRTRCGPWLIVHVFMLVAVLVLLATPALATVSCPSGGGKLEIDDNEGGNVVIDNPACEDWQTLFGGGNSGNAFDCSS